MSWRYQVQVKHLFTEKEDHASVLESMNAIADVLEGDVNFFGFRALSKFRNIPEGDEFFGPVDYANKLLDAMYDYGDEQRIWIH